MILASAGVAFLASFAPLLTGDGSSISSWSGFRRECTIFVLLALASLVVYLLKTFATVKIDGPYLTFKLGQIVAAIGLFGTLMYLGQMLSNNGGASLGFGVFIELMAAIGLTVGGVLDAIADSAS